MPPGHENDVTHEIKPEKNHRVSHKGDDRSDFVRMHLDLPFLAALVARSLAIRIMPEPIQLACQYLKPRLRYLVAGAGCAVS